MERLLNLPTIDAINEFVSSARKTDDTVLVAKDGFKFQIDGSSFLGMINVVGEDIRVTFGGDPECFSNVFKKYDVVR